eukprot:TRINITY_DN1380_c0_g1_i1.p1 TRINITY_DN1380_c0_g1~~TRINITY_DN1380_c0_g1_i1.p1  ORF type:complete len:380 (+),score=35.83 TRINITY_DN1380_c0_g1_i1:96-1142(+)
MIIQCRYRLNTYLLVIFVLFFHLSSSLFIPTRLECGSESDVTVVSTYPHTIRSTNNQTDLIYSEITWNDPKPATNTTIFVDGQLVGFLNEAYKTIEDVNSNVSTSQQIFKSFDVRNLTFDVSTTQLTECAGFYLQANLSNGANVEYTWYVNYQPIDLKFAGTTYQLPSGQARVNIYISGFPYSSNYSAPASRFNMYYTTPLPPPPYWKGQVGVVPFDGPNNATSAATPLVPLVKKTAKNGYLVTALDVKHTIPYYTLKNETLAIHTYLRGTATETSTSQWLIDEQDTYLNRFTVDDNVYSLKILTYSAVVQTASDESVASEGGAASALVSPSMMTILFLFIFLVLFHL